MTTTTALVIGILILAYALVWVTRHLTDAQEAIETLILSIDPMLRRVNALGETYKYQSAKIEQLEAEIEQLKAAQPAKRTA